MLKWFLSQLGLKVDFESAANFNFIGKKSDLVLDMCTKLNAKVYIFGAQGKGYADIKRFQDADIVPIFQDYKCPTYEQIHGSFHECLSIVDLLFNCGKTSLDILMSNNLNRSQIAY